MDASQPYCAHCSHTGGLEEIDGKWRHPKDRRGAAGPGDCFGCYECWKWTGKDLEHTKANILGVLRLMPIEAVVRDCEGGGSEDLNGSLAMSVHKLGKLFRDAGSGVKPDAKVRWEHNFWTNLSLTDANKLGCDGWELTAVEGNKLWFKRPTGS